MHVCFLVNTPKRTLPRPLLPFLLFLCQYASVLGGGSGPPIPRSALSSSTESKLQLIAESVEYEFTREIVNDVETGNIVM